jgi:hypothetical protein
MEHDLKLHYGMMWATYYRTYNEAKGTDWLLLWVFALRAKQISGVCLASILFQEKWSKWRLLG